jgi:hypothetical protein
LQHTHKDTYTHSHTLMHWTQRLISLFFSSSFHFLHFFSLFFFTDLVWLPYIIISTHSNIDIPFLFHSFFFFVLLFFLQKKKIY